MSDQNHVAEPETSQKGFLHRFVISEIHYILMIVLGVVGAAFTDFAPNHSLLYWQAMAPIFGLICVFSQWSRHSRMELIRSQVLHWGIFFLAMRGMFVRVLEQNLTSDVLGLMLLYTLALSTFLAGVYLDWRFCVVGVFLGLCVVIVAMLDQAVLIIALIGVVLVVLKWIWDRVIAKRRQTQAGSSGDSGEGG